MKWEYKTSKVWTETNNISESELNKFGADGWELVAVHRIEVNKLDHGLRGKAGYVYYFKREVRANG